MLAVYIFCAALGVPLLALFALGGGDTDTDVGDAGLDLGDVGDAGMDFDVDVDSDLSGAHGDVGDLTGFLRRIPVSSYAFLVGFFGVAGLLGTLFDFGTVSTLIFAVVIAVLAAAVNTVAFAVVRGTNTTSQLSDRELTGRLATVSVPIDAGKRGRVWLDTGDERVQLTAGPIDEEVGELYERGDRVLIVEIEQGVARVMRADPELGR